uniref:Transient receptor potential protein-like n=1 Tax=Saccoglossus kowalevskii TaxID=10224 RepID=A0ABM0M4P9_SACKO|nr:PREDICTED: transient receptor potential protein-like [Saccoglossus kowalevskii]
MTSLMEYFHRTSGLQNTVSNLTALLSDYSYYIKKASLSNQPSILDPSDYGYDDVSYSVPIDEWNQWDPTLVSSVTFAVANVLSVLRLLRVIVMNDLVGPLQISLSKMNYDIFKFLFIFFFVWVAFGLGISQIYWLYAANNELQCLQEGFETVKECTYEPFGSYVKFLMNTASYMTFLVLLFFSSDTSFIGSFGLEDLTSLHNERIEELSHLTLRNRQRGPAPNNIEILIVTWLIAMTWSEMKEIYNEGCITYIKNPYNLIDFTQLALYWSWVSLRITSILMKNSDTEWKYFRSEMWMSYFEGATIPPPFNILPSPKFVYHAFMAGYLCVCKKAARVKTQKKQQKNVKKQEEYQRIVNQLVVRYFGNVASGHHGRGGQGDKVTKVEFMEFKQDMSSFRYEQLGMVQKLERNMSITNSHINGLVLRLVQMEKINIDVLSVIKEQLLKKSEDHTDMIQGLERKLEESHTEVLAHHGIGNENVRSIAEQLRMQHNRQQHPIPSYINTQRRESQVQANEYDILFATRVNKDPMPTIPVEEELVTENDIDVSHIQLDPKVNEEDVAISLDSNNEVQDFVDAITHGLELREEEEAGEDEEDLEQGEDDLSSYRFEQVMGSSVPVPVLRQSFQVDYDHRLPWQHNSRVGKSPRFQQYMNVFENWEKTDFENI